LEEKRRGCVKRCGRQREKEGGTNNEGPPESKDLRTLVGPGISERYRREGRI
jgi:hypothetical protein